MVKEIKADSRTYYQCEVCELLYSRDNKSWAEECEEWCRNHDSCNLRITNHSIRKTLEDL